MFEPSHRPRVFGLPLGADFPAELASGLLRLVDNSPPEALARVTVLVNTRRMRRRLKALLSEGHARLLPRILLVSDLDPLLPGADLPPPTSGLRRRLELARLIDKLIDSDPSIAPRAAKVDLADSLAALMDEIQGEGVAIETLQALDVTDQSGHWARSLKFIQIVSQYTEILGQDWLDPEARRRRAADLLISHWVTSPPADPVIVAGSTGSRRTTARLMEAVTRLPQGAVVLPGFDFDMPPDAWSSLSDPKLSPLGSQDHPQYRFLDFLERLDLSPDHVVNWGEPAARQKRNELVSLSLRPAPVTDQWLTEGPTLGDLLPRTEGLALIEAPQPRDEALAIAVALRQAVEKGQTAALITPDRTLGRRVAAALQRWNITPDDSAGRPLSLTAPGRFLRQVAGMIGKPADPVDLVALLKHPLIHTTGADRGPHLRLTREFELYLRSRKTAVVTAATVTDFQTTRPESERIWCEWLKAWLAILEQTPKPGIGPCLEHHISTAEALAAGGNSGSGELWEKSTGRDTLAIVERFRLEADHPDPLPFTEYARLFDHALSAENTRDRDTTRPDVMIWGTLEARVQGADLVILGGLNEGVWPARPNADPWLNRPLRRQAGLLLPEREIGLSAHDYQQAIAAEEVILSRARRDADSETVPSRWLSRLTNLLSGLERQNGPEALARMREAGQRYLDLAEALDQPVAPVEPEPRPAPAPPRDVRPTDYTVTEIQRLIRDPYSIYARHVLGLKALDPLRAQPDARLRGDVFHKIVEEAFRADADFSDLAAAARRLNEIAGKYLAALPWPAVRAQWAGHVAAIADRLVADEQERRAIGHVIAQEVKGEIALGADRFSVRGKADRIDRLTDGRLVIYDYKTGKPPSEDQIRHFDRQLPIEAVMAERGGFKDLPAAAVSYVAHIGLGRTPETRRTDLDATETDDFRTVSIAQELTRLLASFDNDSKGYPSRRAMEKVRFEGDYDHLARFGEWDETTEARAVPLP